MTPPTNYLLRLISLVPMRSMSFAAVLTVGLLVHDSQSFAQQAEACEIFQSDTTISAEYKPGVGDATPCGLTNGASLVITQSASIIGANANQAIWLKDYDNAQEDLGGIISNYGLIEGDRVAILIATPYSMDGIENYGTINGKTSTAISLRGGFFQPSTPIVGHINNYQDAVISGATDGVWVSTYSVGTILNEGRIEGAVHGINVEGIYGDDFGSFVNQGATVSKIINLGVIEGQRRSFGGEMIDIRVVQGGNGLGGAVTDLIPNTFIGQFDNAQMGSGDDRLFYNGVIPQNYNVIIFGDTQYGQIHFYDGNVSEGEYQLSGDMSFGISEYSRRVTSTKYESVLTGLEETFLTNTSGTYRGADWYLDPVGDGSWDLIFTSLPVYYPSVDQVIAVPLTARSASFSQQFDGSRVVMHLAESRNREKSIIPTADIIIEGEQSGDTASMSQTIGETTLFGIVRGAWAEFNENGDNPEYSASAWGMTFGAERPFAAIDATIGFFGSYSETNSENITSEDSVENLGAGIHGNKEVGAGFWLDGYGAYYHHDHDISRVDGADTYTADPDGRTWTAYGRLSYADWSFSGLSFTPYVAANYVDQRLEAYEEEGAGLNALSVEEDTYSNVISYVGATASAELAVSDNVSVLPKLDVAWVHLMEDGERDVTTTFVGATDAFAATIIGADQDFARVEASLGLSFDGGVAMRVDYATELGNSDVESLHEVRLEATYQF